MTLSPSARRVAAEAASAPEISLPICNASMSGRISSAELVVLLGMSREELKATT
jgi:hypothetical protein